MTQIQAILVTGGAGYVGAGDAVLSVTALRAAQNAPMEIVGFIGNAVGAQAVATVGNRRPIERVPLFKHIQSLLK